jgi:hypothetical protein
MYRTLPSIWQDLPAAKKSQILLTFCMRGDGHKKLAADILAKKYKSRPQTIKLWPVERIVESLLRVESQLEPLLSDIFTEYFFAVNRPMMVDFLDDAHILHEEGLIPNPITPATTPQQFQYAIQRLLARYSFDEVELYFDILLASDIDYWKSLNAAIEQAGSLASIRHLPLPTEGDVDETIGSKMKTAKKPTEPAAAATAPAPASPSVLAIPADNRTSSNPGTADLMLLLESLRDTAKAVAADLKQLADFLLAGEFPVGNLAVARLSAYLEECNLLRAQVIESASLFQISLKNDDLKTLDSIQATLHELEQLESQRKKEEEDREHAIALLDDVIGIEHTEKGQFPPLIECQEKARQLKIEVQSKELSGQNIEQLKAFSALLQLIEDTPHTDEEGTARLALAISHFGPGLVYPALKHKLKSTGGRKKQAGFPGSSLSEDASSDKAAVLPGAHYPPEKSPGSPQARPGTAGENDLPDTGPSSNLRLETDSQDANQPAEEGAEQDPKRARPAVESSEPPIATEQGRETGDHTGYQAEEVSSTRISAEGVDQQKIQRAIYSLVARADFAGAYWLAQLQRALSFECEYDPALLQVAEIGLWVLTDSDPLVGSALNILNKMRGSQNQNEASRLIAFAAAVLPSLLGWWPRGTEWDRWVEGETGSVLKTELMEYRKRFGYLLISLLPAVGQVRKSRNNLNALRASFEKWRKDTRDGMQGLKREFHTVGPVMMRILDLRPGGFGQIAKYLNEINFSRPEQLIGTAEAIREIADTWKDYKYATERFTEFSAELPGYVRLPGGDILRKILRTMEEGARIALEWASTAWETATVIQKAAKDTEHSTEYFCSLMDRLDRISSLLEGPASEFQSTQDDGIAVLAAHSGLRNVLTHVDQWISSGNFQTRLPQECFARGDVRKLAPSDSVLDCRWRLLWAPELPSHEDLHAGRANQLVETLSRNFVTSEETEWAIGEWLRLGQPQKARQLVELIPVSERSQDWLARCKDAEEQAEKALAADVEQLQGRVRADAQNGVLLDPELEEILQSEIQTAANASGELQYSRIILEQVTKELVQLESERTRIVVARLAEILKALSQDQDVVGQHRLDIETYIKELIQTGAYWDAELALDHLQEILDRPGLKSDSLKEFIGDSQHNTIDWLMEFSERRTLLERLISPPALDRLLADIDQTPDSRWQLPSSPSVRTEIQKVLNSWLALKNKNVYSNDLRYPVMNLLSFLGFTRVSGAKMVDDPVPSCSEDHQWLVTRVSAEGGSPIARFGSDAEDQYPVLLVWQNPHKPEKQSQLLRRAWSNYQSNAGAPKRAVIVFYLGPLQHSERLEIADLAHQPPGGFLVLDEVFFCYLCSLSSARLKAFFSLTIPFSGVNPYDESPGAAVPPEMFVGRSAQIHQIIHSSEPWVIYGGRQLGKSALLQQLKRELEKNGNYIVIDEVVGSATPQALWEHIHQRLRDDHKYLPSVAARQVATITEHIRLALQSRPQHLVLLLDEIDAVLNGPPEVVDSVIGECYRLTTHARKNQKYNFKVVIAGNYHAQRGRAQNEFLEFWKELVIGPMRKPDAMALIRRPMEALGYRFPNGAAGGPSPTVQHILGITFGYAGMTQLLMHRLVEYLHNQNTVRIHGILYEITPEDVDQVLRRVLSADSEPVTVMQELQERFHMTVGLDPEYGIIFFSMILAYSENAGEVERFLSFSEILELITRSWAKGIQSLRSDRARWLKARLDDMTGLGLLIKREEDGTLRYRVRSPKLLRLYGQQQSIRNRLAELTKAEPRKDWAIESHRRLIEDTGDGASLPRYSPFTSLEIAQILKDRAETEPIHTRIILGSLALGMDMVPTALVKFSGSETFDTNQLVSIPEETNSEAKLKQWMEEWLKESQLKQSYCLIQKVAAASATSLESLCAATRAVATQHANRHRRFSVNFLLESDAAAALLQANKGQIPQNSAWLQTHSLSLWTEEAIQGRFSDQKRIVPLNRCAGVMEATGGWPFLVDEYFKWIEQGFGVEEALKQVNGSLQSKDSLLRRSFLEAAFCSPASLWGQALLAQLKTSRYDDAMADEISQHLVKAGLDSIEQAGYLLEALCQIKLLHKVEKDIVKFDQRIGSLLRLEIC